MKKWRERKKNQLRRHHCKQKYFCAQVRSQLKAFLHWLVALFKYRLLPCHFLHQCFIYTLWTGTEHQRAQIQRGKKNSVTLSIIFAFCVSSAFRNFVVAPTDKVSDYVRADGGIAVIKHAKPNSLPSGESKFCFDCGLTQIPHASSNGRTYFSLT